MFDGAAQIAPSEFRLFLQQELIRRTHNNPRYSLRAFARALDYDVSSLSKILAGRRQAGPRVVRRFVEKLGLSSELAGAFLTASEDASHDVIDRQTAQYQRVSAETFQIISDWYHYAILELLKIKGHHSRPGWFANRLGITPTEARAALDRLERVGMVRKNQRGDYEEISNGATTTVGDPALTSSGMRAMQRQLLQKAIVALDEVPIAERDHSSLTFAIDERDLPLAKLKLRQLRRAFDRTLTRKPKKNRVYALTIAFFPLSQKEPKL